MRYILIILLSSLSLLAACQSADETYAVASKEVSGFTKEEFSEACSLYDRKLKEYGKIDFDDMLAEAWRDYVRCREKANAFDAAFRSRAAKAGGGK